MTTLPYNLPDFTVPFTYTHDDKDSFTYVDIIKQAVGDAARAVLGVGDEAELWMASMGMSSMGLVDGVTYRGAIRINGLNRLTVNKQKVDRLSYSFVLLDDVDQVVGWSGDLDAKYTVKPSWVWFRIQGVDLELTDAQRAAIKALVPKKPRAKKTP